MRGRARTSHAVRFVTAAVVAAVVATLPAPVHAAPGEPQPTESAPGHAPGPGHAHETEPAADEDLVTPEPTDGLAAGDTIVGQLVHVTAGHGPGSAGSSTYVETDSGDLIPVESEPLEDVPVGSVVSVTLGDPVPVPADAPETTFVEREVADAEVIDRAPEEAPAAPVDEPVAGLDTLTNEVTLVLVEPAGSIPDATPEEVADLVDGPVADFWHRESNGALGLGVTAVYDYGPSPKTCTDTSIWTDVAADIGWTSGPGRHLALYYPADTPCDGVAGMGTVGSGPSSGGRIWSAGTEDWEVFAHEFGHNFGLWHAALTACIDAIGSGSCATDEYGDDYDMLGGTYGTGALNVVHAARLGFLPGDQQQSLAHSATGGTYTLAPVSGRTGIRGVRLTAADGAVYWLEYRTASGPDEWLGRQYTAAPFSTKVRYSTPQGVLLRRAGSRPTTSVLLDVTPPATGTGYFPDAQVAFPVGRPVSFAGGGFTVTVQNTRTDGATVHVATATTDPAPAATAIQTAYQDASASNGLLGLATGEETCTLAGGGCSQTFQKGVFYSTPDSGTRYVTNDAIGTRWLADGGPDGPLGYPTANPETANVCYVDKRECQQSFQRGGLYWTPAGGTRAVSGPIHDAYTAAGGPAYLGHPTEDRVCGLAGGGCKQAFQSGHYYWTEATGARSVRTSLATSTRWLELGAEAGPLGYPTGEYACGARACKQTFQNGSIYFGESAVAVLPSAITDAWLAAGAETGPLGPPRSEQTCTAAGYCKGQFLDGTLYGTRTAVYPVSDVVGDLYTEFASRWASLGRETGAMGYPAGHAICTARGCEQAFEKATLVKSDVGGGAVVMDGHPITTKWTRSGGGGGPLGYATDDRVCGLPGNGCRQWFRDGHVLWSPTTGAWILTGPIAGAHWADGAVGYPLADATCGLRNGGCSQRFQAGTILWSPATNPISVTGAIHRRYVAAGAQAGVLGYPTEDVRCGLRDGGCRQFFQGGMISWSSTTGARIVTGAIRNKYAGDLWEAGLGYPTGEATCGLPGGGCRQHFQSGSILWSKATGARIVTGAVRNRYAAAGWQSGALGYPVRDAVCLLRNGGCRQDFQGGTVMWSKATGARVLSGAIRSRYAAGRWEAGSLGYPTGEATCGLLRGGCRQHFQGGSVYWSSTTGARMVWGAIRTRYLGVGAERSRYGYPTGEAWEIDGAIVQRFQGGTLTRRPDGRVV